MAKKRVHEIAKAQGLSSKDLLAALKAAGIEAKAAASSVEEADALKAFSAANGDGAKRSAPKAKAAKAPPKGEAKPRGCGRGRRRGQKPLPPRRNRSPRQGGGRGGGSTKKRRVVIDSQAARRDQMGGPPPQRPPRRRGGRRRRPLLEEPPTQSRGAERARGDQGPVGRHGARGRPSCSAWAAPR